MSVSTQTKSSIDEDITSQITTDLILDNELTGESIDYMDMV